MHLKHGLSAAPIGTSIALVQSYNQTANALTAPEVSKIAKQVDGTLALGVALYTQGRRDEGLRLWKEGVKLLGKVPDLQFLKENNNWSDVILEDAAKLLKDPRL